MTLEQAISRLLVSYGSFAFTQTNGIQIASEYNTAEVWERWAKTGNIYFEFHCTLINPTFVTATDDAAMSAQLAAMRAALDIPRQRVLVAFAAVTVLDWTWTPGTGEYQTAFAIRPELTLLDMNGRDYKYGFRCRVEFPGNIPNNNFRRESATSCVFGVTQRRVCTISAEWTAGNFATTGAGAVKTARDNYTTYGNAFFTAYLPANIADQWGTTGAWSQASEQAGPWDDEIARIQVSRTYVEVFGGRQDSQIQIDTLPSTTIGTTAFASRRVLKMPQKWYASSGFTALANYLDNGPTYYGHILSAEFPPISGGAWVLVDADPGVSDEDPNSGDGVLTAIHTYHEVDSTGLWTFYVTEHFNEYNVRSVKVAGTYYAAFGQTAQHNYSTNINTLIASVLTALSITIYDTVPIPGETGYGVTGLFYNFSILIHEIAYPQSSLGNDDPDILFETLTLSHAPPFDPQSVTAGIPVTRLDTVRAIFSARINAKVNTNPTAYWESTLRAFVITRITGLLGAGVTSVQVIQERVGPVVGDQVNHLNGQLDLLVTGGSVLTMLLTQEIDQVNTRDFKGKADGTEQDYYPYRISPEKPYQKELIREGWCEYVIGAGGTPPTLFNTGDLTVSGLPFVDPGLNAQDSLDAQVATGTLSGAPGWFCLRFVQKDIPTTSGDHDPVFDRCLHYEYQRWVYINELDPGTVLP